MSIQNTLPMKTSVREGIFKKNIGAAHVVLKIDGPHGNQAEITLLLYRLCTDIFSVLIFLAFH